MSGRHGGRAGVGPGACLVLFVLVSLLPVGAAAQPSPMPQPHKPDFLFGPPRGSVAIRGSWFLARADSDIFEFVTNRLTLAKSDFNAPAFGGEVGISVAPRVDVLVGIDIGRTSTSSEYRDFVDENDIPITQDTRLTQVNLSGSVRAALASRGREVSRFAWIPRPITPYVGAGGGLLWYDLLQAGDFVDFVDLSIFRTTFRSRGWAPSAHVFGGADVQLRRRVFLELEARYQWAEAELGRDFAGFDPMDLSGLRVTAGVNVLF